MIIIVLDLINKRSNYTIKNGLYNVIKNHITMHV